MRGSMLLRARSRVPFPASGGLVTQAPSQLTVPAVAHPLHQPSAMPAMAHTARANLAKLPMVSMPYVIVFFLLDEQHPL